MFLRHFSFILISVSVCARAEIIPSTAVQIGRGLGIGADTSSCLAVTENADGAPVIIQEQCDQFNATESNSWIFPNGVEGELGTIQIFGDKCLDVTDGVDSDGTKLQIWTCAEGNTNQMWVPAAAGDSVITWAGKDKCVDITNGNITTGNRIQIWDCILDNSNQRFDYSAVGFPETRIVALKQNKTLCATATESITGAPVVIAPCEDGAAAQAWTDPFDRAQLAAFGNLCISPLEDALADGTKLVLQPCNKTRADQIWGFNNTNGAVTNGANQQMCLDLTNGNQTANNQLQIWTCTAGNTNQGWIETAF